jgi:hypothetical protein
VDSATGIVALQEADDTMLGTVAKQVSSAWAACGSQMLALASEFYKEDRLIRIAGKGGAVEVRRFTGTDLSGERFSTDFDVRVRMGTGLPYSRQARAQMASQLIDRGFLNPQNPKDRETVARVFEIGGARDSLYDKMEISRAQAHVENSDMEMGIMHSVNMWDDHNAHIETHRERQRSSEFLTLVTQQPQIGDLYEQHVRAHEEAIQAEMMRQQFLAGGAPPMPVGPNGAPVQGPGVIPGAPPPAQTGGPA